MVVECAGQTLGLPAARVEAFTPPVQVESLAGAPRLVEGVATIHGEAVPVLDGRRRLGISHRPPRAEDRFVVLRFRGRRLAMHVSSVQGVVQASAEDIATTALRGGEIFGCLGIGRLKTGSFVAYDVDRLLSDHEVIVLERALALRQPIGTHAA